MKIQLLVVGALALSVAGCTVRAATDSAPQASPSPAPVTASLTSSEQESNIPLQEQLEGTWSSSFMTVTFNWEAQTYSGVMLEQPFNKSLEFVSEQENSVVFKVNGAEMTCEFREDGKIVLTLQQEENSSVTLKRV